MFFTVETEEGFVKLFAKKISVETPQESVKTVEQILAEEPEPKFRNVRHVLQVRIIFLHQQQ